MSLSALIALVVFLLAFLGAIGVLHVEHLVLWLIAALAFALLVSGISLRELWHRSPPAP